MNSTDENRGRRAGMFWSIYMTGAVNNSYTSLIMNRFLVILVHSSYSKQLVLVMKQVDLVGMDLLPFSLLFWVVYLFFL